MRYVIMLLCFHVHSYPLPYCSPVQFGAHQFSVDIVLSSPTEYQLRHATNTADYAVFMVRACKLASVLF